MLTTIYMIQDINFSNDIKQLIQNKQKNSAFVYIRNHFILIEQALNQGAKIIDIYDLLQKHNINITLPTLRLYLHRLRNPQKINSKNISSTLSNVINTQDIHLIKNQSPNLEELSKAFTYSKSNSIKE